MSNFTGWLPGEDIPQLLSNFTSPVGIEIGTHLGHTTKYLLEKISDLTLHGIDPYSDYTDWNGQYYGVSNKQAEYSNFIDSLSPYLYRYFHHRKTSDEAVDEFEDESLDFIFIDGLHTYDQVLKDCYNYYPKLKKSGLFCGHDYSVIQDVGKAVREFSQHAKAEIKTANQDIWYWYK